MFFSFSTKYFLHFKSYFAILNFQAMRRRRKERKAEADALTEAEDSSDDDDHHHRRKRAPSLHGAEEGEPMRDEEV